MKKNHTSKGARNFPSKSVVIPSIKLSLAAFFKITFAKGSGTLNSPSITLPVITDCEKLNVVIKTENL